MTNADRIRNMTDEELAERLEINAFSRAYCPPSAELCNDNGCYTCWLDWLKQEAGK